jgi:hypothetical protein
MNCTVVAPAGTVTVDGTCTAAVFELVSDIGWPPAGAGKDSLIVPVELTPPVTGVGLNEITRLSGLTVRVCEVIMSPGSACTVAVIVVVCAADTDLVVTVNDAVEYPAGMVTVKGTSAAFVFELLRATTIPPVGARWLIVTVPFAFCSPPITLVLSKDSASVMGIRVSGALALA